MRESKELRERTKLFALRIIRGYGGLPKTTEAQVIGRQVLRSGTSVGALYREASRARSDAEYKSKIGAALQALDETAYWLELLVEGEIVPAYKLEAIQPETEELIAIFTRIVKKVRRKDEGGRLKAEEGEYKDQEGVMREEEPAWEIGENELLGDSDFRDTDPDQVEPNGSPAAQSSDRKVLPETDNSQKSAKKRIYSSSPPTPPPLWEIDDEALLSDYSSFDTHPSSLQDSFFNPQPAPLQTPHLPALEEKVTVKLDGESYSWDGKIWRDEYFVTPPKNVIRRLNEQVLSHLVDSDNQITNIGELLIRARQARESLQFERAEGLARRVISLDPGNTGGAAVLCASLRGRGRPREALEETIKFTNTTNAALFTSRGAAYCDLKMWSEAKLEIGRALAVGSGEEAFMVVNRIKAVRPELYKKG